MPSHHQAGAAGGNRDRGKAGARHRKDAGDGLALFHGIAKIGQELDQPAILAHSREFSEPLFRARMGDLLNQWLPAGAMK